MNQENQVSPGEETQNPAPDVVDETPELTEPENAAEAEAGAKSEEDDAEKALKRMQRRIDKRTADVYRTRAENEQLRQRLAEIEAQSGGTEQRQEPSADPVRLAKEIAAIERFNEKANSIYAEGTKAHKDFETVVLRDLVQEIGPLVQQDGKPSPFMEVVLEVSDKPADLLHYLGANGDVAEELAGLSPYKLAKKLASIESTLAERSSPKTSQAPKPLEPLKPKAPASNEPSDNDSLEVWMAKERARMKSKGITRYG